MDFCRAQALATAFRILHRDREAANRSEKIAWPPTYTPFQAFLSITFLATQPNSPSHLLCSVSMLVSRIAACKPCPMPSYRIRAFASSGRTIHCPLLAEGSVGWPGRTLAFRVGGFLVSH